ncbi:MAG: polysaccharide deacetylase family protein [Lachnospiraceae bacterium]
MKSKNTKQGYLVISLDMELLYGMNDETKIDRWKRNAGGAREVIPEMLTLFEEYGIKATWAIVGMLFAKDKEELRSACPVVIPQYEEKRFSNYERLDQVGETEEMDPLHYAASLIKRIAGSKGQEIATHTFSHYYCMEKGQTKETFEADLAAAIAIAQRQGITTESLVFPKNQYEDAYLEGLHARGILAVRGNERSWMYRASSAGESLVKRAFRLADSYVNLSGYHDYSIARLKEQAGVVNIPASRFFRPYSHKLRLLEPLRLARIKGQMHHAAKHGLICHLWWHPHNFGSSPYENLHNLREILTYNRRLQSQYSFSSATMSEIAKKGKQYANRNISR